MSIENGWFNENETMWEGRVYLVCEEGQRFGLKVKEVLYHAKSKYQVEKWME